MSVTQRTSSSTGTLYFGYGSNLSPTQMVGRCPASGVPIAVARLNSWFWIITKRGYANIVPVRPTPTALDTEATTVWGIIYNLTSEDEATLDWYEGYDEANKGPPNPIVEQQIWKPFEQGSSTYNKMYLAVRVEKWLVEDPKSLLGLSEQDFSSSIIKSLVYVDEQAQLSGRIKPDYVSRMGRSARECLPLGVPERWINVILGQHGIDKNDPNSFTGDIKPGKDATPPEEKYWESIRVQFLIDERNEKGEAEAERKVKASI